MSQVIGLDALKNVKLPDGIIAVGELLGFEDKESNGKFYYKLKLLIGDTVKKFDVKPDLYIRLKEMPARSRMIIKFYDFQGKFGINYTCTEAIAV